jgi:hypothetical protein
MLEGGKMSPQEIKATAEAQREEAKKMLSSAVGLPANISSGTIDRAVDCIIGAAMLEITIIISEGMQEAKAK